ncbi:LytTR family DNA-binding domain-containing protein [uncultured Lacinutrix sp.]|uniref:LytR/AlgR family response regulator transcription factor n=1 Tax=uncultured Lacinutrix sp. TaxID=574032 RepID=UPI00260B4CC3|nr:LytTR family DNA-binding domain-containing protein [uncultured Lacinutrix sp.]
MTKVNAIIVDDEVNNVDLLVHFLTQYCPDINIIGKATTKSEGVSLVNELKPELLFLDIMLDQGTGFDLLEEVTFNETKIIFVTAFDEFAIKAFKYNAVDYILKPIEIDQLIKAVEKACLDISHHKFTERHQVQNLYRTVTNNNLPLNLIAIPSKDKIDFVKIEDIIYIKSEGRYSIFNLKGNKQIVATKNLGEYETMLDANTFFRIHNSYLINLTKVLSINKSGGNYCVMENSEQLPIAKRRQDQLHRFLKIK